MAKHLSTSDEYIDFIFDVHPAVGASHVVWRVDELDQLARDLHRSVLDLALHGTPGPGVDAAILERLHGTPARPPAPVLAAE